ncbi:Phox-like protein [Roridomyces roridus]|uniref:Endosomal/vacuolar adapter protein YPT35 n=1 Tax=Roridomyces roridus TaxID=1738132 RepID=A0AAD7CC99_9AGAR|nr:Phox-like protein [Roridomyces roridus]
MSSVAQQLAPSPPPYRHPFANSTSRLEIIPNRIDVAEESQLYDDLLFDESPIEPRHPRRSRSYSPVGAPSVFSNDIWLGDNTTNSSAFAREVQISGWTSVGDALGGAYVVYDCVLKTREGNLIHAHKRYSDFVELENRTTSDPSRAFPYFPLLRPTLPLIRTQRSQRAFVPDLPPKSPLARYRVAFLARRRNALEHWLSCVLLHPDLGGCEAVRRWVVA